MDDFPGLLARDYGFKPQGKSAPMAPPRSTNSNSTNFNLGSGGPVHTRSSSSHKPAPLFDNQAGTDGLLFNDVFGGPPKYSESRGGASATASSFDLDSIFKEQNTKSASLPIFDKPVYDDDIFNGLPGLKSSSSGGGSASAPKFDDAFGSVSSPPKQQHRRPVRDSSPFDDLLGNLGKKETEPKRESGRVDKDSTAFDDLLPGFGRISSHTVNRSTSEPGLFQKPSLNSARSVPGVMEDPFVVLESTSSAATSSSGLFTEPLEEISKTSNPGNTKVDNSSVERGVFEDLDHLDDLGKSVPYKRWENRSPLRTGPSTGGSYYSASQESVDTYPVENAGGRSQKKTTDDYQESHETIFNMPTASTDFHRSFGQNVSPPSYVDVNANEINSSPRSEEVSESSDDVWLSVSEIPLFTQPTSATPPSRPPPPRPPRISKSERGSFSSTNSRKKVNEYPSFQNSASYSQSPRSDRAARNSVTSQIDELEDFVTGRTQNNNNEFADVLPVDDVDKTSSAAASAAMKEAMDKAEAKIRQMREREYLKAARNKEAGQLDKDMLDAQLRELKEREERFDRERKQREKEEEEREQRRFEKERERTREIERERGEIEREQRRLERERERAREIERERDKARQVVERATREARERAAAEARERAERAAVQRAQAEARERAAAEAKERAERAAAEARERANAEGREREARERAAFARAEGDARLRAERAAVERAAAEARERAASAARANHQKSENDLESFFSTRANSAPRPRDPFSDSQNNRGSEAVRKTSVGAASSMRKASSAINIVDDLTSLFGGGAGSSREFQEVEGETEERRKARLERHQRTQERAAKALAEKNQRDLQAQREQAERHRIAETLDVEIKRWAAGKEGNLRALLSTLQYVLWPECGWQPVSLTDLITAAAVKKVYRKATLSIHPDKVQQKGANLQQKYVAEKVFDLLKEAWNKFNSEELF
ncbi:auxilin-related protein 1 isoform X3 [Populus alba]|uniref:auxilin-related protein 1 isoform X3 n=1 Tax=Populus alba TaxID=43335 RepID=UPI0015883459|nr:auxilin-related protein 1-like isoform X3 [Populus alba]